MSMKLSNKSSKKWDISCLLLSFAMFVAQPTGQKQGFASHAESACVEVSLLFQVWLKIPLRVVLCSHLGPPCASVTAFCVNWARVALGLSTRPRIANLVTGWWL